MDFQIRLILQSWAENVVVTHQLTELMIKVCVHVACTFQIYLKVTAIGEEKKERTFIELLVLLLVSQFSNEYGANLSLLASKPVPSKTKAQCGSIQFLLYDPIFLS